MLGHRGKKKKHATVSADKGYDWKAFVNAPAAKSQSDCDWGIRA
jgi:hypothetical protein